MNEEDYKRYFLNKTIRENAIEQALDTRKFEIDLYWKRATYFWAFIAATFAGYFLILSKSGGGLEHEKVVLFFINCLGFAFSYSWYLVNRGSKHWQENWEKHVDLLENKHMGPLFKVTLEDNRKSIFSAGRYSVSKINIILSLFITVMWLVMGLNTIFITYFGNFSLQMVIEYMNYERFAISILLILVIVFVVLLYKQGKTKNLSFDESIQYTLRSSSNDLINKDLEEAIAEEEKENEKAKALEKEACHGQAQTGDHRS